MVSCKHMAAIALSAVLCPQITPMNVMPIWWKRKQWREQVLLDVYAKANITIKSVKEGGAISGLHFTFVSQLDSGKQVRAPKEG